jgi:hypothetical protein
MANRLWRDNWTQERLNSADAAGYPEPYSMMASDAVHSDERQCITRMMECYRLENPILEQEWYLAGYEVRKADNHRLMTS